MSDQRKQPGIVFYAACILAVPVLYFVLLGPVVWIWSRTSHPEWVEVVCAAYCLPLQWLYELSPKPIQQALRGYVELFSGTG
jgi:hypothetical protein